MRVFNYVHIARTGGNYLLGRLVRSLRPKDKVIMLGYPGAPSRDQLLPHLIHDDATYLIHSHGAFGVAETLHEFDVQQLTVLRRGEHRLISEILWLLRLLPAARSEVLIERALDVLLCGNFQSRAFARPYQNKLIEWAHLTWFDNEEGPVDNDLAASKSALSTFAFVGDFARLDQAIETFAGHLGITLDANPVDRNASPASKNGAIDRALANPKLREAVLSLTTADKELYAWVRSEKIGWR
jgi:hypothetical protein